MTTGTERQEKASMTLDALAGLAKEIQRALSACDLDPGGALCGACRGSVNRLMVDYLVLQGYTVRK